MLLCPLAWSPELQAQARRPNSRPSSLPLSPSYAAIGISGSRQTIFAAEIDESMAAGAGGGGLA